MRILSNAEKGNSSNTESCEHAFEKNNSFPIYKSLPKILILHILRYTWNDFKAQKSDFQIDIPNFLNFDGKSYKLRSVCLHAGSCEFGHYGTLIYKNDELFFCSDSLTGKVEENNEFLEKNENAYIIFYELEESSE